MTPLRQNPLIDYARTCDRCSKYVPKEERFNRLMHNKSVCANDIPIPFVWYDSVDEGLRRVSYMCDTCYVCARLEGWG